MASLFQCPPAAALTVIPDQECAVRFEQFVKFFFQRKQTPPSFSATTILDQATWTPLLSATDATKIVKTPFINNPIIPPGEPLTEGGNDNTTIGGVSRLLGAGFQQATFELRNADKDVRTAIQKLTNETALVPGYTSLWAYPVNRFGQIIANADGSGIPLYNFFLGDPGTEGYNRDNVQNGRFDLAPGWADNVVLFTPSFDILAL